MQIRGVLVDLIRRWLPTESLFANSIDDNLH